MNPDDLLDETVEYANVLIEAALSQDSADALGALCNNIARHYRAMGLYDLLMHADIDGLHYGLTQSGLTRLYYLRRAGREGVPGGLERRASFADPFFDAVAASHLGLAAEIARLTPREWMEGYEYEDDYAYARFVYELVETGGGDPAALQRILDRFAEALEGQFSDRLAVCEALIAGDQEAFDTAFAGLLNAHRDHVEALADPAKDAVLAQEPTFQANRWVFVEGLALLRMAERLGLQTEPEYDRCPSIARRAPSKPFVPDSFPNLPLP